MNVPPLKKFQVFFLSTHKWSQFEIIQIQGEDFFLWGGGLKTGGALPENSPPENFHKPPLPSSWLVVIKYETFKTM